MAVASPCRANDIILAEYGAVVVGLEMIRSVSEEEAEKRRKQEVVKSALSTLSSSELEAIRFIFDEIEDNESVLIASKIADKAGITRSVIVNALRKLESALFHHLLFNIFLPLYSINTGEALQRFFNIFAVDRKSVV